MPLIKKLACVIVFDSATAAMEAESYLPARGLPGRIIPIPEQISAGCGLSWKAEPEDKDRIVKALDEAGIKYAGVYVLKI